MTAQIVLTLVAAIFASMFIVDCVIEWLSPGAEYIDSETVKRTMRRRDAHFAPHRLHN